MDIRSASEIWETTLGELQVQLSRPNYDTWLRDTRGLELTDGGLTVGAPTTFAAEWLRHRLAPLVSKTVTKVAGRDLLVRFAVMDAGIAAAPTAALVRTVQEQPDAPVAPTPARRNGGAPVHNLLNPRYSFDAFIVGAANRFAHAAALAVTENPGGAYNPLFVYGGVGLGKTHLLHAIGQQCQLGDLHVLYTTSEQFTNEFIHALRERKNEEFRAKYRSVDVLLIDDIHFIADKEQTQESFFHTFNDLHTSGRQIVISSDRAPGFMPLLEDRLRSRFEWGLIADIQPPDLEMRLAILQSRADEMGLCIDPPVFEVVAHRFPNNIRQLEGAFNRVIAFCRMAHLTPTVELAETAIAELLQQPRHWSPSPTRVIQVVAEYHQVTPEDLQGPRRSRDLAFARQIAMYLLRQETTLSLADIGKELGGRDHSTVLHGWGKVNEAIEQRPGLRRVLGDLLTSIRSQKPA